MIGHRINLRHRWLLAGVLIAAAIMVGNAPTTASPTGFTRTNVRLDGGHVQSGSPTLADITGDGVPEILIGTTACRGNPCTYNRPTNLEVWRGNGTKLWSVNVGAPINSAPSVGDIDGDGDMEIVVSIGGAVDDMNQNGGVVAYNHNGVELWRFHTIDHYPNDGYSDGVFSTPALCDTNGNGKLEIAFGAWDQRIYLLDHNGVSLWNNIPNGWPGQGFLNGDSSWSSPACVDLNGDGLKEIIIGADITGGGVLPDGTQTVDGGFLYIFDKDGSILVRRYLPEAIYASPAVGDLNNDGNLEIVSGTAWYWWYVHGQTSQPYVYAFSTANVFSGMAYDNANKLPYLSGWPKPTTYPGFSSPALADLDGDGRLEVIIGTGHPFLNNDAIPGAGKVHAWHHDGRIVSGWPISPKNANGDDAPIFSSPTVADVDGDGAPEILFSMLWDVFIYNHNGTMHDRLGTNWTITGSPAVGDTLGNGKIEIWIGGANQWTPDHGFLYRFENGVTDPGNHPWPMFRGNASHTGLLGGLAPRLTLPYDSFDIFHQPGSTFSPQMVLKLTNPGDFPYNWNVSSAGSNVQVTPSSGTVGPRGSQLVTIKALTQGLPLGVHARQVTLTATNPDGRTVQGTPATINFNIRVVSRVYRTNAPMAGQ